LRCVELNLNSVFRFGIGRDYLGILPTDTEGKLGKDFWYDVFSGNVPINDPNGGPTCISHKKVTLVTKKNYLESNKDDVVASFSVGIL